LPCSFLTSPLCTPSQPSNVDDATPSASSGGALKRALPWVGALAAAAAAAAIYTRPELDYFFGRDREEASA
jgi:hypothetical protein